MDKFPESMESMEASEAFELGKRILIDMAVELESNDSRVMLEFSDDEGSLDWFDTARSTGHSLYIFIENGEFGTYEVESLHEEIPDLFRTGDIWQHHQNGSCQQKSE